MSILKKLKNKPLLVLLVGILIGIVIGIEFIKFTDLQICPKCHNGNENGKVNIIPVVDRGYFQQTHELLKNAKKSIHMIQFEVKYYERYRYSNENILVRDLVDAKNRGVDVKIIVDEYSKRNNAFNYLQENGVDIRYDSPDITTHAKLIIIDGKIVILGSTNWSYYGLDMNREANVILMDSDIAQYFEDYFMGLWSA